MDQGYLQESRSRRGSGVGYLQGIPAGFDTIKIRKTTGEKQHGTNVIRRMYAVGRPKLTTNSLI